MLSAIFFWLMLTLIFIAIQGFFSMQEMAAVSFNKARLHYYVSKGNKRAAWLNFLLYKPSRLFGTTLIMINIALQIGSECSREFYKALGLSPNLAPLSQVLLVVIFAELVPMFLARRSSEHVSNLGIPIVYATSKVLTPIIWIIELFSRFINLFINKNKKTNEFVLSREELQKTFEVEEDAFTLIVSNIFQFRSKKASQVMEPLNTVVMAPSNCTIEHMRSILKQGLHHYLPVYHRSRTNIIGIAYPRELINAEDNELIRKKTHSPWFITEDANIMETLQQFQHNHKSVAVVLDKVGNAIGILALKDILDEIFGEKTYSTTSKVSQYLDEKTFSGDFSAEEFDRLFNTNMLQYNVNTLAELVAKTLGHHPQKEETIIIDNLEFKVEEITMLGIKTISIKSKGS
jgi:putative hemolysin